DDIANRDCCPGGEDDGPAQMGWNVHDGGHQHAGTRGTAPGSAMLSASRRLLPRQDDEAGWAVLLRQRQSQGAGAFEVVVNVNNASDMPRLAFPDFIRFHDCA